MQRYGKDSNFWSMAKCWPRKIKEENEREKKQQNLWKKKQTQVGNKERLIKGDEGPSLRLIRLIIWFPPKFKSLITAFPFLGVLSGCVLSRFFC